MMVARLAVCEKLMTFTYHFVCGLGTPVALSLIIIILCISFLLQEKCVLKKKFVHPVAVSMRFAFESLS
jgi:hypothetical protein